MSTHTQSIKRKETTTSYGVICVTEETPRRYFVIHRASSIGLVCLITGQFAIANNGYIMKLVESCSQTEIDAILAHDDYEELFKSINVVQPFGRQQHFKPCMKRKWEAACIPDYINLLKKKGYVWSEYTGIEFPKGRVHGEETPVQVACREFGEECGELSFKINSYVNPAKTYKETYYGMDGNMYATEYFIARIPASLCDELSQMKRTYECARGEFLTCAQFENMTSFMRNRFNRTVMMKQVETDLR